MRVILELDHTLHVHDMRKGERRQVCIWSQHISRRKKGHEYICIHRGYIITTCYQVYKHKQLTSSGAKEGNGFSPSDHISFISIP